MRAARYPTVTFWASNYGDIRLPLDFPVHIFRRDGWWDQRFTTLRHKWENWIAFEEEKLRGAPNRLKGARINNEGDAI